jgi:pentatricopeptide repeat protein
LDVAVRLIHEMRTVGHQPLTAYSYSVLLKGYGRAKRLDAVRRTLLAMRTADVEFDQVSLNSAVDAYVRCGDLQAARAITDAPENATLLDTRTFNTLLKGFARNGDITAAFEILDEIRAHGCTPNDVTQNTLVDACVRVGDLKAALKLAETVSTGPMEGRSSPHRGNQLTIALSRILAGLADSGNIEEASNLLREMHRRGAPPNHITYCVLINACMRQGLVQRAWEVFHEMKRGGGVQPTVEVYNAMISGLCKTGDEFMLDAAVGLLRDMRQNVGSVSRAHEMASTRLLSNECASPAPVPQVALSMPTKPRGPALSLSLRNGVAPSHVTYNMLIDGLVCFNRHHEAEDVLEWMHADGVAPTVVTYTTLIKGWGADRNWPKARQMFQRMSDEGIELDRLAFNAFISVCARAEKVKLIDKVLTAMERGTDDLSPDLFSYSPLIALHARNDNLAEVWAVYKRARAHGLRTTEYLADMMVNTILQLGPSTMRFGRPAERAAVADMAVCILDDAWTDVEDKKAARDWRRALLELFLKHRELRTKVANAGGGGALRSASEKIFEQHGWNEIDSGWRAF